MSITTIAKVESRRNFLLLCLSLCSAFCNAWLPSSSSSPLTSKSFFSLKQIEGRSALFSVEEGTRISSDKEGIAGNGEDNDDDDEYEKTYRVNLQLAGLADQVTERRYKASAIGAKALELFETLNEPDTVSYNSLLKVLAKISPSQIDGIPACRVADEKFAEMKALHEKQLAANTAFYNNLSGDDLQDGAPLIRVKPNARTYATVMDCFARTGCGAERCEDLLNELNDRYYESGKSFAFEPNLIIFNTVLTAYGNVGGGAAATKSLELLNTMPIEPDRISYNAVLHAIAKSGWKDAGERAENLLRTMSVEPGPRSYTTAMDAWSQSGHPDRAHALLTELTELYESGNDFMKPNVFSYTTVIHAYVVSKVKDKVKTAYKIFNDMKKAGTLPNRVTYNIMLNCCATVSPAHFDLSADMLREIYHDMKQQFELDHVTFGTVLKACSNLLEQEFAVTVFQEACQLGQVSNRVLRQFRQVVPIDIYREQVGNERTEWHELPSEWTCNVREEQWSRRNNRR